MEKAAEVRVRFAPSPTGYLHIGSARTALFNWLFAQAKGGSFILRIEDTDKKRSKDEYLKEILESLKWLGLAWHGKPYYQSKRTRIYKRYARRLLQHKKAYEVRGGAVFFKVPKERIVIADLIHGPIEFDNTLQGDLVILKSDGSPAYNFACVVDDIEMKITHIIRGDDHISNTPKQIAIYQAFETEPPLFAHLPLILGEDRCRLSKRHGAVSISEYKKEGYLPEALVNFLALLGWSPGDNREIVSKEEIIKLFSLERAGKTGSVFDQNKLNWINSQYIKAMDTERLMDLIRPYIKRAGGRSKDLSRNVLRDIVSLYKTRLKRLSEFSDQTEYLFVSKVKYDREAASKFLRRKELKTIFSLLINDLRKVTPFNVERVEKCCRDLIQRLGIGGGALIHPVRVAITGRSVSPGLFDVMCLLGKERTIRRLREALKRYCK